MSPFKLSHASILSQYGPDNIYIPTNNPHCLSLPIPTDNIGKLIWGRGHVALLPSFRPLTITFFGPMSVLAPIITYRPPSSSIFDAKPCHDGRIGMSLICHPTHNNKTNASSPFRKISSHICEIQGFAHKASDRTSSTCEIAVSMCESWARASTTLPASLNHQA